MAIEKRYSLSAAARAIGIDCGTLRRWFEIDLGIRFPNITRGSKHLVTEAQIDAVLRKRAARVESLWIRPERNERAKLERVQAYLDGKSSD
jgi:transposase-like protein